jgi:hypothetical protein
LRAAPFVNPLALSAFSTALTHGLFFFIECSLSVFWTHLPVNSPRHLGSCAVFLPLSWVLMTPVFVDALMDLDVLTIGGSTTAPEPGKPITRWEQTFKTKTIDRAPRRSDPFQAPNPEIGPAMLVRSGPGISLLYAPDFPGRKSPCRNAAEAHVCEKHDGKQRIVVFICM